VILGPRARIRASALLAPIVLTGCDRVYSASDYRSVPEDEDALPVGSVTMRVARHDVYAQWELPPGSPWGPYQKLTLFSALEEPSTEIELPDVASLFEVGHAQSAAVAIARAGVPHDAAWFVDLRGAASVAFARALNEAAGVRLAIVPTFNNWPADDELVPAEETLAAAILFPPPRAFDVAARPMFLLDAWRLAYKDDEVPEDVTDNRYALGPADFPSAEVLLAQGIRRVVYVVPGASEGALEEDDLNDVFRTYEAAGIEIDVIGLDDFLAGSESWVVEDDGARPAASVGFSFSWSPRWRRHIGPRRVIVRDPWFHARAHGGWGGVHAMPLHGLFFGGHGGG
jgi:hypothetical protein